MDWKIELVAIPVTDVDRAKAFYVDQVGFHADHDHQVNEALRFVQLTPPGSACSIVMGTGITEMAPGSQKGIQIVVADVEAARQQLIAHSVQASDVDAQPWGSFVTFSDPDGNTSVAVGASYRHSAGNGAASITLPALCPKYPGTASVREQVCGAADSARSQTSRSR
jgi:catechol 2,3-dioxygenase-like lactoylglutathione lyase family enzyme